MALQASEIIKRLSDARTLPVSADILQKVKQVVLNPDASVADVAEVVAQSPGVAAGLLSFANSAAMMPSQEVRSVKEAVSRLGKANVMMVTQGVYLSSLLNRPSNFNTQVFFRYSVMSAFVAKALAKVTNAMDPEEAFLAGLLHDLGVFILDQGQPKEYQAVIHHMTIATEPLASVETRFLGLTHSRIGAELLKNWHLSTNLVAAILFHAEPGLAKSEYLRAAHLICLAEHGAIFLGYNNGVTHYPKGKINEECQASIRALSMNESDFIRWCQMAEESMAKSAFA